MKELYSNRIFDCVIFTISVLSFIDSAYLLTQDFENFNVLTVKTVQFIISILSISSFFFINLHVEFYSRLFILAKFILPPIAVYFQFAIDQLFYLLTRTTLISNPIIHSNFLIGIVLFLLSNKFSQGSKIQRQGEYGTMIMLYGIFLLLLTVTKVFDSDNISIIIFVVKLLLSVSIIFVGRKFGTEKLKCKAAIISTLILAIISGML